MLKKLSIYILKVILILVVYAIITVIIMALKKGLGNFFDKQISNSIQLFTLPLALVVFNFLAKKLDIVKIEYSNYKYFLIKIIVALTIIFLLSTGIILVFEYIYFLKTMWILPSTKIYKWVFMVLILFELAFIEEIIFRNLILKLTTSNFNNVFIITFLNGFIFSIVHFQSFFDGSFVYLWAIAIFSIGLFLSAYTLLFKDLTFTITFHFLWNLTSTLFYENDINFNLLQIIDYQKNELLIGNIVALVCSLCLLVGYLILVKYYLNLKVSNSSKIFEKNEN